MKLLCCLGWSGQLSCLTAAGQPAGLRAVLLLPFLFRPTVIPGHRERLTIIASNFESLIVISGHCELSFIGQRNHLDGKYRTAACNSYHPPQLLRNDTSESLPYYRKTQFYCQICLIQVLDSDSSADIINLYSSLLIQFHHSSLPKTLRQLSKGVNTFWEMACVLIGYQIDPIWQYYQSGSQHRKKTKPSWISYSLKSNPKVIETNGNHPKSKGSV